MVVICTKSFKFDSDKTLNPSLFDFAVSYATCINSLIPWFFNADISHTGTPKAFDNSATLIISPFFLTESIILSATTTGISISKICVVKYKFLSRFVASIILITQSGFSSTI